MTKRDWYFQVPDTTIHDDESDCCTCPNCLARAEREAKERSRQLEFDFQLRPPEPVQDVQR